MELSEWVSLSPAEGGGQRYSASVTRSLPPRFER
jgi:hypothetical protein